MRQGSQNRYLGCRNGDYLNKSLVVRSARAKWLHIAAMLARVADRRGMVRGGVARGLVFFRDTVLYNEMNRVALP